MGQWHTFHPYKLGMWLFYLGPIRENFDIFLGLSPRWHYHLFLPGSCPQENLWTHNITYHLDYMTLPFCLGLTSSRKCDISLDPAPKWCDSPAWILPTVDIVTLTGKFSKKLGLSPLPSNIGTAHWWGYTSYMQMNTRVGVVTVRCRFGHRLNCKSFYDTTHRHSVISSTWIYLIEKMSALPVRLRAMGVVLGFPLAQRSQRTATIMHTI